MEAFRREAEQETQMLFGWGPAFEAEILLEAHALGLEGEEGDAHADRRRGHGGNAEFGAAGEDVAAEREREEVESVDEKVGAAEEVVDGLMGDASVEAADPQFRIDRQRHFFQHGGFGSADRGQRGADLAVEIGEFELVEVGDGKGADAQARECQEMDPADAAHSGDGEPAWRGGPAAPNR